MYYVTEDLQSRYITEDGTSSYVTEDDGGGVGVSLDFNITVNPGGVTWLRYRSQSLSLHPTQPR